MPAETHQDNEAFKGSIFRDSGCSLFDSCLQCPLVHCVYDYTGDGEPATGVAATAIVESWQAGVRDPRLFTQYQGAWSAVPADVLEQHGISPEKVYRARRSKRPSPEQKARVLDIYLETMSYDAVRRETGVALEQARRIVRESGKGVVTTATAARMLGLSESHLVQLRKQGRFSDAGTRVVRGAGRRAHLFRMSEIYAFKAQRKAREEAVAA